MLQCWQRKSVLTLNWKTPTEILLSAPAAQLGAIPSPLQAPQTLPTRVHWERRRAVLGLPGRYSSLIAAIACALVCSFGVPGFGQSAPDGSKAPAANSQHSDVKLSEQLSTQDRLSVKLTLGQKKAIESAQALGPDSAAVFKSNGTLVRKGPARELDNTFKACKDLQPISDSCWLCKDNGTILCSTSQNLKPASSGQHVKPDSK